jgi:RNA polymerase sigma-70 factor (ECF subfamily)
MDIDPDGTEAEIWRRALSRDGYAFAELFEMHQARVYRRALGLLENVHDAEEVVSSVFFELWRKRRVVRLVDGSVLPWLIVTAVNTARNRRRSIARYRRLVASLPRSVGTEDAQFVALENL